MRKRDIVLVAVITAVLTTLLNVLVFSLLAERAIKKARREMINDVQSIADRITQTPPMWLRPD